MEEAEIVKEEAVVTGESVDEELAAVEDVKQVRAKGPGKKLVQGKLTSPEHIAADDGR